MGVQDLVKFQAAASADPALAEKILALLSETPEVADEKLVALAASEGCSLTAADVAGFRKSNATPGDEVLSETDLENIAGGAYPMKNPRSPFED